MKSFILIASLFFSLFTTSAFALPVAPDKDPVSSSNRSLSAMILKQSSFNYEGIVALNNCSGSLIQYSGQPMSAKALVLTNGHCVGDMPKPGEAYINIPVNRRVGISDAYEDYQRAQAVKLQYATMTGTDIAIYELSETYQEIYDRMNVRAYILSPLMPLVSTPIDILSGYWKRGYTCSIDAVVPFLSEAGWTMVNSLRYSSPGCETIGGTSGSPIIEKGLRSVVGINNTGNEDGEKCTMNNPCEIDEDGNVSVIKGASYGQQTYNIYTCVGIDFAIDTSLPGCSLHH